MTQQMRELALSSIEVSGRAREDYGDIEELAENIKQYGLLQPITVVHQGISDDRPQFKLLAGGRRYYASEKAGLSTIPAVIRDATTDADALEIELIENVFRKDLTWQEEATLRKRIYELKPDWQRSLRETGKMLGVSHTEVKRSIEIAEAIESLPELKKHQKESDAWKSLTKLKEGLVIQELQRRAKERTEAEIRDAQERGEEVELPPDLQAFRWADECYVVGDAIEAMNDMHITDFNFAEVDPPYGIELHEYKRGDGDPSLTHLSGYQEVPKTRYEEFLDDVAHNVKRLLSDDSFCVWWFGPTHYYIVREAIRRTGLAVSDIPAIWYKGNQGQTQQPDIHLANCYEMFFVARKGKPVLRKPGRSNVFHYTPVPGSQKIHSTEKPLDLMQEILDVFALPGAQILCPFAGSGVTIRAARTRDMKAIGWDLDKEAKGRFMMKVQEEFGE